MFTILKIIKELIRQYISLGIGTKTAENIFAEFNDFFISYKTFVLYLEDPQACREREYWPDAWERFHQWSTLSGGCGSNPPDLFV